MSNGNGNGSVSGNDNGLPRFGNGIFSSSSSLQSGGPWNNNVTGSFARSRDQVTPRGEFGARGADTSPGARADGIYRCDQPRRRVSFHIQRRRMAELVCLRRSLTSADCLRQHIPQNSVRRLYARHERAPEISFDRRLDGPGSFDRPTAGNDGGNRALEYRVQIPFLVR